VYVRQADIDTTPPLPEGVKSGTIAEMIDPSRNEGWWLHTLADEPSVLALPSFPIQGPWGSQNAPELCQDSNSTGLNTLALLENDDGVGRQALAVPDGRSAAGSGGHRRTGVLVE
jgi:hypothetical protein